MALRWKQGLVKYGLGFLFSFQAVAAPWDFEIMPYIWATNMNGSINIANTSIHIDESFSDLLRNLDMGGMLYLTAHHENLGFYINGVYAALSDKEQYDVFDIQGKDKFGVLGAGFSYLIFTHSFNQQIVNLEPYGGMRYTFNNTTIKINDLSFKRDINWMDPVVGMQLNYRMNLHWALQLSGDVGGTSLSSDYSYSAAAFIRYQAHHFQRLRAYLGYRLLSQKYRQGENDNLYEWDIKLFGPVLGIGYIFR